MTKRESFDSQIKRGTLEMLLLRLVRNERSYGYDLVSQLDDRSEGLIEIKEGTLYPVLYRLEDSGFIRAEWDPPERGAPRKYYSITDEGRDRLAQLTESWRAWVEIVNRIMDDSEREGTE